jgi:hypothetical protein
VKQIKLIIEQKLAIEIEELVRLMDSLSSALEGPRVELKRKLEKSIREAVDLPQLSLQEYGSFKTSLLTPFSDVDFLIEHLETLD